jgi:type IV pilus biogenesis protein CpaD/CtpE
MMKITMAIKKVLWVLVLGSITQLAMAQADAAKTIAGILSGVSHYPSEEQKTILMTISNNKKNSAATKTIAKAVHDMQHAVSAEDKVKLVAIAGSSKATAAEKELAAIVGSFNHVAGDDVKARLAKIQ